MTVTRTINSVSFGNALNIKETDAVSGDPTSAGSIAQVSSGVSSLLFDGTASPQITADYHAQVALVSGALTIDLTSLADALLGTTTMLGLKLRLLHLTAPTANAGPITIKPGGTNGYAGWSGAGGLILSAKDIQVLGPLNGTAAVGSSTKTLDLTGTGTDGLIIVAGFGP